MPNEPKAPTKPSEIIRAITQQVVQKRFAQDKDELRKQGELVILSPQEQAVAYQLLGKDPMTWVMAIMGYLDGEAAKAERPSTRMRPELSNPGCAIYVARYGTIAGQGLTPEEAMLEFDRRWAESSLEKLQ